MNKRDRKTISGLVALLYLALTGYLFLYLFNDLNVYLRLGVILIGMIVVQQLTFNSLPAKKTTKQKSTSRKTTENKQRRNTPSRKSTDVPHNRQLPDNEILQLSLEKMSWREFERLCFLYYKAKGYKPKETKNGADGGVDLIYYHPDYKGEVAVQIKHYKNDIDVKLIRELTAAKRNHGCLMAEFITTSGFTNPALIEADKFKIETHGRQWVEDKIVKWKAQEAKRKKLIHV